MVSVHDNPTLVCSFKIDVGNPFQGIESPVAEE